jgi:thioredoxin-like negative regulator of GroEL
MSAAVARRYFVRAREQLRHGDMESACQEFGAAVELQPGFVAARIGYALTLARSDPPRAAQALRAGLLRATRVKERRDLSCALGDVLVASGDYPGAEAAYADAASLPGAGGALHDRLARLRAKTGRFAEALAEFLLAARES